MRRPPAGARGPGLRARPSLAWCLAAAACLLLGRAALAATGGAVEQRDRPADGGERLYLAHCASCHGASGAGTNRGPALTGSGGAAAHFMLSTGRMPITDPDEPLRRRPPAFDDADIAALVDYLSGLGDGAPVPEVDVAGADLARGGQLYRLNCAACHGWGAAGGGMVGPGNVPSLKHATDVQVAEAVRIGPGRMPLFGRDILDDDELADVVAYVSRLRDPDDPGGFALGHLGPFAEGAVALAGALAGMVLLTRWVERRR